MDLPTYLEANYIATFLIKLVWVCCYIIVYGIRPVVIRPKKVGASPACTFCSCCGCSYVNGTSTSTGPSAACVASAALLTSLVSGRLRSRCATWSSLPNHSCCLQRNIILCYRAG